MGKGLYLLLFKDIYHKRWGFSSQLCYFFVKVSTGLSDFGPRVFQGKSLSPWEQSGEFFFLKDVHF